PVLDRDGPKFGQRLQTSLAVVRILNRPHCSQLTRDLLLHARASLAASVELGQYLAHHYKLRRIAVCCDQRLGNPSPNQHLLQRSPVPEDRAASLHHRLLQSERHMSVLLNLRHPGRQPTSPNVLKPGPSRLADISDATHRSRRSLA